MQGMGESDLAFYIDCTTLTYVAVCILGMRIMPVAIISVTSKLTDRDCLRYSRRSKTAGARHRLATLEYGKMKKLNCYRSYDD